MSLSVSTWNPPTLNIAPEPKYFSKHPPSKLFRESMKLADPNLGQITNPHGHDPHVDPAANEMIRTAYPVQPKGYVSRLAQIVAIIEHGKYGATGYCSVNAASLGLSSHRDDSAHLVFKNANSISDFLDDLKELGYVYFSGMNNFYRFDEKNVLLSYIESVSHSDHETPDEKQLYSFNFAVESAQMLRVHHDLIKKHLDVPNPALQRDKITTITGFNENGFITTDSYVKASEQLATPGFYPWMAGLSIEDYIEEFLSSSANVAIFFGIPGTGKSTFIRTAIARLRLKVLLTNNPDVMTNPAFISYCGQKLAAGEGRKYDMLVAEDADALMMPRAEGNQLMQMLLNATNGIVSDHQFKIVLTTNQTDLEKIDPALMRAGRCFDLHEFGYMSKAHAAQVRKELHMPPLALREDRYTLAQLTNISQSGLLDYDGKQIVQPRFNFREKDRFSN